MSMLLTAGFLLLIFHYVSAECSVEMVTREQWGARFPRNAEKMDMPVHHIFIHHTATGNCTSKESCSRKIRGIQKYHMDDRGWDDIGYNFLIGGDGRVYVGRGWDNVGAHTYGYNRISIAFSLIGNYQDDPPPSNMLDAAKNMIECARNQNYVDEFQIHGHRDATCTLCPGQAAYDIIKTWNNFIAGPLPRFSCKNS